LNRQDAEDAKEKMKAKKSIDDQGEDAASMRDDAEERIDDLPENTEDSIQEVAKMLASLVFKPKVAKSAATKPATGSSRTTMAAIQALTQVVKTLAKRQKQADSAMNDILMGLGVADQIQANYGVAKSSKPVLNADADKVIRAIRKVADEVKDNEPKSMNDVRKNLKSGMNMLFGGK